MIFSISLFSQASGFQVVAATDPSACSNVKLDSFAMNSNNRVMTPGKVKVALPSRVGDLIVVVVGLNQWKNPVTTISDFAGTRYTLRVKAFEPAKLTGDHEPDALLEIYSGIAPQNNPHDVVTVYSRSGQFDVFVGSYSGVSGIGANGSMGGKSNRGSFSITMTRSSSYLVGGLERYSGPSQSPGIATTVGKQLGAISTRGSNNNAGSDFMEK